MSRSALEFSVTKVEHTGPRAVLVEGRNFARTLHVGDQFNIVYRLTPPTGDRRYVDLWQAVDGRAVGLLVETIAAYGHELQELAPGLTARLHLVGEGGESIRPGEDVLGLKLNPEQAPSSRDWKRGGGR